MDNYRHEYKYIIGEGQKQMLLTRVSALLLPDSHADSDGEYLIRSLYFDDLHDGCLAQNEDGSDPRAKFRLRYYNDSPEPLRLEKKSKCRGLTLKHACTLTSDEAARLASGEGLWPDGDMPPLKQRLLHERAVAAPVPKVIVTYRRRAFVYTAGNVRITFDSDITSSDEVERFLSHDYRQRPVLPPGRCILEVKWDEVLPAHIKHMVQLDSLQWSAFSKYYYSRRFGL